MTKRIALIGMLAAMTAAAQVALAALPNIEVVTFLLFIYALYLPYKDAILISIVFSTLQALLWGFGDWVVMYYWVWSLWVTIVYLLRDNVKSNFIWILIHSVWGLSFGLLAAINYGLFYGKHFMYAYWVRGIPFDVTHMIGNYIVAMILITPVRRAMKEINKGGSNEERFFRRI